jgi:hypothetical protein
MVGDDAPVLTDDYTVRISMDLDRTAHRAREYLLLSKRTRQVFETEAGSA